MRSSWAAEATKPRSDSSLRRTSWRMVSMLVASSWISPGYVPVTGWSYEPPAIPRAASREPAQRPGHPRSQAQARRSPPARSRSPPRSAACAEDRRLAAKASALARVTTARPEVPFESRTGAAASRTTVCPPAPDPVTDLTTPAPGSVPPSRSPSVRKRARLSVFAGMAPTLATTSAPRNTAIPAPAGRTRRSDRKSAVRIFPPARPTGAESLNPCDLLRHLDRLVEKLLLLPVDDVRAQEEVEDQPDDHQSEQRHAGQRQDEPPADGARGRSR